MIRRVIHVFLLRVASCAARARAADPEFYPLLERLRRIQDSGAIGLRVRKTNEMEVVLLSFRGKVDPSVQEYILWVRKTLELDPAASDIRVVYGSGSTTATRGQSRSLHS